MTELDSFFARCNALAAASGLSPSTISSKLFNDGKVLKNLTAGKDVGVRRLAKASVVLDTLEQQYGLPDTTLSEPVSDPAPETTPAGEDVAKPESPAGVTSASEVSEFMLATLAETR